jgi:putative aldouronate transport system substrate-binding protein
MNKQMKRIGLPLAALILAAILVWFILYAQRDKDDRNPQEAAPAKHLSIMLPLHQSKGPPEPLIQEIENKTGYTLSIQWIPDDIYSNKMLNVLENKNSGQAMFVKPTDITAVKSAIRSDLFWNIGPYLEYYPNLKLLNTGSINSYKIDGKIYGLSNERPESRQGVIIRRDWLERLGLQEPRTIDDLYKVMKAFAENDPDGNGKPDTLGLADRGDLYYGAFKTLSSYFGTPNGWLLSGGKLTPEFETPEYLATMDFMKKLYNENIINKDFPVTSKSVQRFMFITGKAGVYIGSLADAPRLLEETRQVNPAANFTVINRVEGPKGYGVWSTSGSNGMFLFSKMTIKTEEELKEALAFFDRTMDKDVSNLLMYGIENVHYKLIDGMVSITDSAMYTLANNEVTPLNTLMIANITNPNLYKRYPAGTDPFLQLVNEKIADNSSFLINNPAAYLSSDTYDARNVELNSIISNATYNYILGKLDREDYIKETEFWRERGGNQVIEELEQDYKQAQ